jgi:protein involved in polysaccharide export with SLBB domain
MRQIQVRRSGKIVTTFDFYDLLLRGDKTKDVALQPGDVIFIPPAGKRVALAGSIETAAIYEIGDGTSLGDLLTYAGGLSPVAAGQHAVLERINHRAALDSKNIELDGQGLLTPLADGDIVTLLQVVPRFEKTVAVKGNVADPFRIPWRPGMRVSDAIPDKQALLTRDYWTERNRLTAGGGGFVDQVRKAAQDDSYAAATAGDKAAAVRKFATKNDVQQSAPDINWSYASIERVDTASLSTQLLPIKLGKIVVDHDPAEDLELQPGDVITIFSTADFIAPQAAQTRYVRLEGEIRMAGVYSVAPGETLRDVIARAGGLTPKAYVYGAQFTRESTKREQQKRLSDYIDQLEKDIEQSSSALASRTVSPEQEAAMRISLQQQKGSLERLREVPASGRIVLNLSPDKNTADAFPPLPLENGDRLVIPAEPSTVSVMGTVYNQSTFLHQPELNVRACLQEAGGPTKFADRDHIFVIRADGSIVSRGSHSKFDRLTVFPGDTVVVPTNVTKTSRMRAFLDMSQVMSGFGVSAAAVNVLK